jgi:hypothetical protein
MISHLMMETSDGEGDGDSDGDDDDNDFRSE